MDSIATKLETIINTCLPLLKALPDSEFIYKPSPLKWSKKEIMGHLIDSAQTNIRRFVVAQYEEDPFIIYNQDRWVNINYYQHQPLQDIIQLWYLLNKQMIAILRNTSGEMAQRTCKCGETHTIRWLASDYNIHLTHHLHHVLNLDPVAYPKK